MLARDVRECDVADFSLLAQPRQRSYRGLEGDSVIRGMELIDIDPIETQTLEAAFQRQAIPQHRPQLLIEKCELVVIHALNSDSRHALNWTMTGAWPHGGLIMG